MNEAHTIESIKELARTHFLTSFYGKPTQGVMFDIAG
ncbi:hypothetical protein SAMN05446635_0616 [Burkholderia sp. OK233]|nr:hypothetical protein SAMN05446635_0616 [Burkholderia sp. OK233]